MRLSADRWVLTFHPLKLQTIPSYSNALYVFTPFITGVPLCVKVMKQVKSRKTPIYRNSIMEIIYIGATLHVKGPVCRRGI